MPLRQLVMTFGETQRVLFAVGVELPSGTIMYLLDFAEAFGTVDHYPRRTRTFTRMVDATRAARKWKHARVFVAPEVS